MNRITGASKNRRGLPPASRKQPECKADGAQRPRHNRELGEGASTAQRSNQLAGLRQL